MSGKRFSVFSPKRSIVPATTENAKLVGYLRHSKQAPAVVLPVFTDADEDNDKFLYQRINERGVVSEFVFDPDLTLTDLVLDLTFDAPPIVSVGELPLHAYEIRPHSFVAGRREKFRSTLKDALGEGRLAKWPFAALEVAKFVGDNAAEEFFAKRCAIALMEHSRTLATSWLAGSSLSRSARDAAQDVILQGNIHPGSGGRLEVKGLSDSVDLEDIEGPTNDNYTAERPAGLEWLNKADLNHESWARVWREIWSSTRPFPRTREEHAVRGLHWLAQVHPDHGGWASVWYRIWGELDEGERAELFEEALRWLRATNPRHLRWPFIWRTLWDLTKLPDRRQRLAIIAHDWLGLPNHSIADWADVWLRQWDFHAHELAHRAILRSQAYEWLGATDFRRKQWSIIWQIMLNDQSSDELYRKLLIERGLSWLRSKRSNLKTWKLVWAALWKNSDDPDIRDELMVSAKQWFENTSFHRGDWAEVWLLIWGLITNENSKFDLQKIAEQWLVGVRSNQNEWVDVWLALWKFSTRYSELRARLVKTAEAWMLKAPENGDKATVEQEIRAFRTVV